MSWQHFTAGLVRNRLCSLFCGWALTIDGYKQLLMGFSSWTGSLSRGLTTYTLCPAWPAPSAHSSLLVSGPGTQQLRPVWKLPLLITNLLVTHNLPGVLIFESTSHPSMVLVLQVGDLLPIHCCCCSARWHCSTICTYTWFWWLSTIGSAGGWDTSWGLH